MHSLNNERNVIREAPRIEPACVVLTAKPPIPWQERGRAYYQTGSPGNKIRRADAWEKTTKF